MRRFLLGVFLIAAAHANGQARLATAAPGGGGGFSSPAALSTETYNPAPHPFDLGATIDLPQAWVTSAKGSRTYVRDTLITDQGSPTANMDAVNAEIVTCAATNGDTRIRLAMGLTYQGTMWLLPHTFPNVWTDIEAETAPCAEGIRCTPATMTNAPVLHAVGNDNPTIACRRGADRYRVMGVTNVPEPTATGVIYFTVRIHAREPALLDEQSQSLLEHCPRDIVLDRILVTGPVGDTGLAGDGTPQGRNKNGVTLEAIRGALVDSWVAGQYNASDETHGVAAWNTPGPLKIVNNYIDGGSVPLFFGGAMPGLGAANGKPSDLELRRNYLAHPEAWCPAENAGATKYAMKGLFELKNAKRVLFEGNVLERCPSGAQNGMATVIKSAGDGMGASTGLGTSHVTFRYNLTRSARMAFNVSGYGDPIETDIEPCHSVACYHNLFHDIGIVTANGAPSGTISQSGNALLLVNPTNALKIRFNTFVHNVNLIAAWAVSDAVPAGQEATGFDISDNASTTNSDNSSFFYSGGFVGVAGLNKYATGWSFKRNFLVGLEGQYTNLLPQGDGNVYPDAGVSPTLAAVLADADFVDAASHNYRLAVTSPGKGIGLGGADPGCDLDTVEMATAGVAP